MSSSSRSRRARPARSPRAGPLIGDREGPHLIDLVAEELDTARVLPPSGEDVEECRPRTANSPRTRDHVDAVVARSTRAAVICASSTPRPPVSRTTGAASRAPSRSAGARHARRPSRREARRIAGPRRAEHLEPTPRSTSVTAQTLVGKGLPMRGSDAQAPPAGASSKRRERGDSRDAPSARSRGARGRGRSSRRRSRSAASSGASRTVGKGEIRVENGEGERLRTSSERAGAPGNAITGNCHRTILRSPADTPPRALRRHRRRARRPRQSAVTRTDGCRCTSEAGQAGSYAPRRAPRSAAAFSDPSATSS